MSLDQQHAVIIGGSSGIGLATAQRLSKVGARITIASRDPQRLESAADELGGTVHTRVLDCTDEDAVVSFFSDLGPFDHLITTAGDKAVDAPIVDLDTEVARRVFEVKYWGQYFAAKHGVAHINDGGSITLFSAWLARKPTAGFPTYAAIDGAIESLAGIMKLEFAPVRVNVVSPGVIDTPLFDNLDEAARNDTFAGIAASVPLGRVGTASDVARAVEYLVTNPYSSGAVIDVDGGWS